MLRDFIIILVGFIAGVFSGLLGIGGGSFVVPALVLLFAFDERRAHGTSLVVVLALAAVGAGVYASHGHVNLVFAVEIAVGGVIGAMWGARLAQKIKGQILRHIFALIIALAGIKLILGGLDIISSGIGGGMVSPESAWALMIVATGILTGVVSALLGVGGGIVMIPVMVLALSVPQKLAQGISLAAMLPTAFTGALMHWRLGNVDFRIAKWICLGGIIGAYTGARLAVHLPTTTLKLIFGSFLILMTLLLIFKRNTSQSGHEAAGA